MEHYEHDKTEKMDYENLKAELNKYRGKERNKKYRTNLFIGIIIGIIVGIILGTLYQRIIYMPNYDDMYTKIYLTEDKSEVVFLTLRKIGNEEGGEIIAFETYDKKGTDELIKQLAEFRKEMA